MRQLLATLMTGCPMTHLVSSCSPMCQTAACFGLQALSLHFLLFEFLGLTSIYDFNDTRCSMQGCCWRLCGMHRCKTTSMRVLGCRFQA